MAPDENGITAVIMRLFDDIRAERVLDALDYFVGTDKK